MLEWKVVHPGSEKKFSRLSSPLGDWFALWGSFGLFGLGLGREGLVQEMEEPAPVWLKAAWTAFWNGEVLDVNLCTERRVTPTTGNVWNTVLALSFGETLSYGEVAVRSGIPGGARAVGSIMRSNPWALFLPCHRVIGKDGQMRGYGGPSGVPLKLRLIEFERKLKREKEGSP